MLAMLAKSIFCLNVGYIESTALERPFRPPSHYMILSPICQSPSLQTSWVEVSELSPVDTQLLCVNNSNLHQRHQSIDGPSPIAKIRISWGYSNTC